MKYLAAIMLRNTIPRIEGEKNCRNNVPLKTQNQIERRDKIIFNLTALNFFV